LRPVGILSRPSTTANTTLPVAAVYDRRSGSAQPAPTAATGESVGRFSPAAGCTSGDGSLEAKSDRLPGRFSANLAAVGAVPIRQILPR